MVVSILWDRCWDSRIHSLGLGLSSHVRSQRCTVLESMGSRIPDRTRVVPHYRQTGYRTEGGFRIVYLPYPFGFLGGRASEQQVFLTATHNYVPYENPSCRPSMMLRMMSRPEPVEVEQKMEKSSAPVVKSSNFHLFHCSKSIQVLRAFTTDVQGPLSSGN